MLRLVRVVEIVEMLGETMSDTEPESNGDKASGKPAWVKWVLIMGVIAVLFGVSRVVDIPGLLTDAMAWIEGLGYAGMAVFIMFYILACVLVLPGSVLTLGAGATYGLPMGFAIVSIGSTLGATSAFVIGRYLARDAVAKKVETNPRFKLIDDAVGQQGWKIVFLTRLTPLIPFSIQNYGYGLTNVRLGAYVLASWIGMMPGTVLYTYIGTLGGQAAQGNQSAGIWAMRGVALVATIAVTVVISRIAKKALDSAVPTEEQS